ncbi:hypothetical protein AVEN_184730-1 [Araneus ventricosus]|uniref:BTB domain-containing protein n=1 Tax=Araneus ventricosus TaxID=182803 RepID=A0A4Y2L931_ARAVE|nr:hypothetical protein AVEN_184730-1 [Araneus ventricosus]
MDSDDFDLVLSTEISKISYKMKWSIDNAHKIPESIKSPKFSFVPGHDKDWFLSVKYSEDNSICVLLSRDSKDDQPLRVECTTCVVEANEERFSVTLKSIFQSKETRVICNHLCTFPDKISEDERTSDESSSDELTLNLEFSFVLYGLEIETDISYCDEEGIDDADENGKNFGNMMKIENLADVRIHVGKEVFTAHKFILRLRAPKFVDKHLRYGTKTTLHEVEPRIFKSLIGYIYKN